MNTNRNLHSTKVLTEFARDFDDEEETGILSQFVNKLSNIVNTNYNSLSGYPSTSSQIGGSGGSEVGSTGQKAASKNETEPELPEKKVEQVPTSLADKKPDELPLDPASVGRTPLNVIQRISNLIAQKDNVRKNFKF